MSVDWFTVAAQIVNFLILVWLLKKFLYKPVLSAMTQRQEKIKAELEQASVLTRSAKKEKRQYLALQEDVRERGREEFRRAHRDAEDLREKLFKEVRAEAEMAHVQLQEELGREKALFLNQASSQVAVQFHHLAHNAFRDLADENFEKGIVARFCALIATQDTEQDFFHHLHHTEKINVVSAFPLTGSARDKIKQVLWERISTQPEIDFLSEPTLIAGIVISSNDHKLEWNIHNYLDDFQAELQTVLSMDNQAIRPKQN